MKTPNGNKPNGKQPKKSTTDTLTTSTSSSLASAVAAVAAAAAAANGLMTDENGVVILDANGEPKKRVSANKKERRRTQSINNAFTDLRNRIPQIPTDTKLSKIKTLKLAINYIEHLMKLLQENDPTSFEPFRPDLGKLKRECRSREIKLEVERKAKGRTGWPSEVWSTELKRNTNSGNHHKSASGGGGGGGGGLVMTSPSSINSSLSSSSSLLSINGTGFNRSNGINSSSLFQHVPLGKEQQFQHLQQFETAHYLANDEQYGGGGGNQYGQVNHHHHFLHPKSAAVVTNSANFLSSLNSACYPNVTAAQFGFTAANNNNIT